jgi:GT2 family glycosyltransferase/glycosyltransferase involved in cell wall biosynthesis
MKIPKAQTRSESQAALRGTLQEFLAHEAGRLEFPRHEAPLVSLVIVTYEKAEYTFQCLTSVLQHSNVPYEVILVDNASKDRTADLLERVRNATVIRNRQNLHFVHGCNQAAERAKGRELLFLNNDACLTSGALAALVATLESVPRAGAVGAKLVWSDGWLQEAGSIIWSDGSTLGYGRGDDPAKGEYGYLRDVDYCSGACLLVRKSLFDSLGGFDQRYAPAYYEDSDLCMGIRALGYRVLYQPRAVVVHHEFTSSSRVGAESLCEQNRPKFVEKWSRALALHLSPAPEHVLEARDTRTGRHVLVLDDRIPMPDRGSGFPRMFAMLKCLSELGYKVTFIPVQDMAKVEPDTERLQQLGIEVLYGLVPLREALAARKAIAEAVIVSRPHNAAVVLPLARDLLPAAVLIYDAEALWYQREERRARLEDRKADSKAIMRLKEMELGLIGLADRVITVSEKEREMIGRETGCSRNLFVWGHAHETYRHTTSFSDRKDILFVGGFLNSPSPNEDAITHFVSNIFPGIREQLPGVRLLVVGAEPPKAVRRLASPSVVIMEYVADLRALYGRCRLFINPVRYAAGIPIKLIEAMSAGLPAVVNEAAASGLGLQDGEQALIAHDDREFAEKTVELYHKEELWLRVREKALQFVEDHYHPDKMRAPLARILECPGEEARLRRPDESGSDVQAGMSHIRKLSLRLFRTPWSRLPGRAWLYYREHGPRFVLSKTGTYLLARLLGR